MSLSACVQGKHYRAGRGSCWETFCLASAEYLFGLMAFKVARFQMQTYYLLVMDGIEKKYTLGVIIHVFPLICHWGS